MKQSDIFTVILVASIGMIAAFVACNTLLGDPDARSVTLKVVRPISRELTAPNPETFNDEAINPTIEVYVGGCRDLDGNGILSEDELQECKKEKEDNEQGGNDDGDDEDEQKTNSTQKKALNSSTETKKTTEKAQENTKRSTKTDAKK